MTSIRYYRISMIGQSKLGICFNIKIQTDYIPIIYYVRFEFNSFILERIERDLIYSIFNHRKPMTRKMEKVIIKSIPNFPTLVLRLSVLSLNMEDFLKDKECKKSSGKVNNLLLETLGKYLNHSLNTQEKTFIYKHILIGKCQII